MRASTLPGYAPVAINPGVCAGLALAAAIAWVWPFDRLFAAATLGWPALRAAAIVVLAVLGGLAGQSIGLRLTPQPGLRRLIRTPIVAAVGVAIGCAGLDLAFRPRLDPSYLNTMVHLPWQARSLIYMAHAFNEEILYRLFLGSLLACGVALLSRAGGRRPSDVSLWIAFALAQGVNVWLNLWSVRPFDAALLPYDLLRFFAPGMVWAWLYVRRGFVAAEAAHLTTHLIFQPLSGALLSL